ncbi:MAG: hypothetical protein MPF33_02850 [Candidatus Aramenus sp.]|nr:hypothetical protein [Candidatus Aramenus sp.]
MSLVRQLLAHLNKLRGEHGVPPVNYANTGVANFRANYMLKENLFSHYDREGVVPNFYLTRAGIYYGAEESIGFSSTSSPYFRDGVTALHHAKKLLEDMVYNDEGSGWGHRDSLLDPCHNYADVSLAWDSRRLFLDIIMLSAWVKWDIPPRVEDNVFKMRGEVMTMSPEQVLVLRYVPSPSLTSRGYYDLGEPVAGIAPRGYRFLGLPTVIARRWEMGRHIDVEFDLPVGSGVYTVLVLGKDPKGISWEPKGDPRRVGVCKLLTYTFKA